MRAFVARWAGTLLWLSLARPIAAQAQPAPEESPAPGEPALTPSPAGETAPPSSGIGAQPALKPPTLKQNAPVELPPDYYPAPNSRVLLELWVEASGRVRSVTVLEAPNPAVGDAAARAARNLVFEPARRDGEPVPARIRFRYTLAPRPEDATPTPPPRAPAEAQLLDAPSESSATDADSAAGNAPAAALDETEPAGEGFGATATVSAPARELTRRPLTKERIGKLAGANNDPLRAIELLPGVARPPLGSPDVLIRGSGPSDSTIMLEGTPVLFLYHIGGLKSFVNPELLRGVDVYPGNFSVRYGRAMGGAIDARLREPERERMHGVGDVSLLDASLMLEGPLGDDVAFAVAGRRSYVDALLAAGDDSTFTAAPVYWDYQGLLHYDAGPRDTVSLRLYGSKDSLALVLEDESSDLPELRGQLDAAQQFHRAIVAWDHAYGGGYRHSLDLGIGYLGIDAQIGELVEQHIQSPDFHARGEAAMPFAEWVELRAGIDFVGYSGKVVYEGPSFRTQQVDPAAVLTQRTRVDRHVTILWPAAYAELTLRPLPAWALIPGVRIDHFGDIGATTVDPRFNTRLDVTDDTTLKAGVGRFSQPPELGSAIEGLGDPELGPSHALHVGAGVEQRLGPLSIDVEGYAKWLSDLVVNAPRPEGGAPASDRTLVNEGEGRIYGLELALELELSEVFALLSYSLSRSERLGPDGKYVLFDFDQPHNLVAAAGYDLGRGWLVSSTFRLASGALETPVEGALYDADDDRHIPIYGDVNSRRAQVFHRLDARVEKRFDLSPGSITFYLDVQNVLDHRPVEATAESFDHRQRLAVRGLPVLPVLGVRGEL